MGGTDRVNVRSALFAIAFAAMLAAVCDCRPHATWRGKRQASDYALPSYSPLPGRSASRTSPTFPFTTNVNGGLAVDGGTMNQLDGFLNVPVPTWGLWDMKGGLEYGQEPYNLGYGVVVNPTNALKMSPQGLATALSGAPQRQTAKFSRRQALLQQLSPMSAAVLPGPEEISPLTCVPPLCNPFMQTTGFGVSTGTGNDVVGGGLDFPIPLAEDGVGTRFPLSGGLSSGNSNVGVNFAQHVGPIDPFRALDPNRKKASQRKTVVSEVLDGDRGANRPSQGLSSGRGRPRQSANFAPVRNVQSASSGGIVRSVFRRKHRTS